MLGRCCPDAFSRISAFFLSMYALYIPLAPALFALLSPARASDDRALFAAQVCSTTFLLNVETVLRVSTFAETVRCFEDDAVTPLSPIESTSHPREPASP